MAGQASPVVARWELALRLRTRREQEGIDVRTITKVLGVSRNYWSAVENERTILAEDNLRKVISLFEFGEDEERELLDLRVAAKEHGWWSRYSAILGDDVQRLFGLEHGAQGVRCYENLIIPGILQTPDYARAVMESDVTLRLVEVDQRVEARMRRQERLIGDKPLRLRVLLSEAALRQEVGGPTVLRGQLEHLVSMVERHGTTIEIRVIPFTVTACGIFGAGTIQIIDFANPRLPTVIWRETVTSWGVIEDKATVRDILGTYREATERAMTDKQSLHMIIERLGELG